MASPQARSLVLAPGMWCLVLPLPYSNVRTVNAYLLAADGAVTLIDCGSSAEPGWDLLRASIEQTGHDVAEIELLVCTHMHSDHAGLAGTVAERTGCLLARGAGLADGYDAFRNRLLPIRDRRDRAAREGVSAAELETLILPGVADDGHDQRIHFDRELSAGERLHGAGGDWEVIPAPGHAATQIVLFETGRRWLISADLISPAPMLEYGSMADPLAQHRTSLDRIAALDLERLLPGHGRPIGPADAARERVISSRRATDAIVECAAAAITDCSMSGYELSKLTNPKEVTREGRLLAFSTAVCVLEHLEAQGRAVAAIGDDGVRRFAAPGGGRRRPGPVRGKAARGPQHR